MKLCFLWRNISLGVVCFGFCVVEGEISMLWLAFPPTAQTFTMIILISFQVRNISRWIEKKVFLVYITVLFIYFLNRHVVQGFGGHLCRFPELSCSPWDFLRYVSNDTYKAWLYLFGVEILCRHDVRPFPGHLGWMSVGFKRMQLRPRGRRGGFSSRSSELGGVCLCFIVSCPPHHQAFLEERYLSWLQRPCWTLSPSLLGLDALVYLFICHCIAFVLPFSIHPLYPATEFLEKCNCDFEVLLLSFI